MPNMETFLTNGALPLLLQMSVVFMALWWSVGERAAALRAGVLTVAFGVVQMAFLLAGAPPEMNYRPVGFDLCFFSQCILPLPMVFLLAWLGMRATPDRAHDAVGLAIAAPLLPLFMRSSVLELTPALVVPVLLAVFLSFWLSNAAGNHEGRFISRMNELSLSLAQVADCLVLFMVYLMTVAPLVKLPEWGETLVPLIGVALVEFAAALLVLRCSLKRALIVSVAAGLLLPLMVMVVALTLPY